MITRSRYVRQHEPLDGLPGALYANEVLDAVPGESKAVSVPWIAKMSMKKDSF